MALSSLLAPILGVTLIGLAVGAVLLLRSLPRGPLSPEERGELAKAPIPRLQRRAWWGLAISGLTLVAVTSILFSQGAAAYWENDDLRLLVLGIFLGGLFAYVAVVLVALAKDESDKRLDERDQLILRRAATTQVTMMILTLAAWLVVLPKMFHEQGAVPVVYLYLMFGSVILVALLGQSLGILIGYWIGGRFGQS